MKRMILVIAVLFSLSASAQTTAQERDSVANTSAFQLKVKMATHKAAGNILADPQQLDYVKRYAQLIITEPNGSWIVALSYGCMTNVAVNYNSSDGDIEFTINSLFVKFAKAYYRITQ